MKSWLKPIVLAVGATLVVTTILLAFVWPTKTLTIHNIPISLVGPEAATGPFETALEANEPGVINFIDSASREQAVSQIKTRETYGAVILAAPGSSPEVLTAPAANNLVAQMLNGVAQAIQAQVSAQVAAAGGDTTQVHVAVTPIVPLSTDDPTGSGLTAAAFPLMIGGIIGGVMPSFLLIRRRHRALFIGVFAVVAASVLVGVLQGWFGFLQGNFWANLGAVALGIAATAALVAGLNNVLGRPGLALGAAFTFLVANPLSSAAMPWQFIAEPWGEFGQDLVPGASNWLIRSLSYFPDADVTRQWLTLGVWFLAGVVLLALPKLKRR